MISSKQMAALLHSIRETGVFVCTGYEKPNVMVTHTGVCGKLWSREVFILPVRAVKHSAELIEKEKVFTVNVPAHDMRKEIASCDVMSGFVHNKFDELHLNVKRARKVESIVIAECSLIVECKLIASVPPQGVSQELFKDYYGDKVPHTLYIGEIVDAYDLTARL